MTTDRDDIFKMAREAGFSGYDSQSECLTHFFKLAYEAGAKDEREACAKVCDPYTSGQWFARAIRARGDK